MKSLHIESQIVDTYNEACLLHKLIQVAQEAGYTRVQDNWGHKAYDTHTIEVALVKFQPMHMMNGIDLMDDNL